MIEHAIRSILVNDVTVTSFVEDRIYYSIVKDHKNIPPYIVITNISDIPVRSLGGYSGLNNARIQITCYSTIYKDVMDIANYANLALEDYTGISEGITIYDISPDEDTDEYIEDQKLSWAIQDYIVRYKN